MWVNKYLIQMKHFAIIKNSFSECLLMEIKCMEMCSSLYNAWIYVTMVLCSSGKDSISDFLILFKYDKNHISTHSHSSEREYFCMIVSKSYSYIFLWNS